MGIFRFQEVSSYRTRRGDTTLSPSITPAAEVCQRNGRDGPANTPCRHRRRRPWRRRSPRRFWWRRGMRPPGSPSTEPRTPPRHEPSFDLLQHLIERFVFYSLLFKRDRSDANAELYYAAWNLFPWANDVILVRWGEGMGTTVDTREECLSARLRADPGVELSSTRLARTTNAAVPIVRLRPSCCGGLDATSPSRCDENRTNWTPSRPGRQARRGGGASRTPTDAVLQRHVNWLETVRFLARLMLLPASFLTHLFAQCTTPSAGLKVSNGLDVCTISVMIESVTAFKGVLSRILPECRYLDCCPGD